MNKWMPSRKEVVVVVVVTLMLGVVLKTTFGNRRETERLSYCQSNLKKMGLGLLQYARDHDEHFPLASSWMGDMLPYTARNGALYHCPSSQAYGYGMNRYLAGEKYAAVASPESEPVFFDVLSTQRNATADENSWMSPGRHKKGNNVAFVDGHVKWMQDKPSFNPIPTPKPRPTPTPKKTAGKS